MADYLKLVSFFTGVVSFIRRRMLLLGGLLKITGIVNLLQDIYLLKCYFLGIGDRIGYLVEML